MQDSLIPLQNTGRSQRDIRFKRQQYRRYVFENCRLPHGFKRYEKASLSDFPKSVRFEVRRASITGFYVYGDVGTGKTHLLLSHYKDLPRLVKPVYRDEQSGFVFPGEAKGNKTREFVSGIELLLEIRSAIDGRSNQTEREIINKYKDIPFLYIDDIGAEKTSEWSIQTFYIILNHRNNMMKPTFFSSNLDPSALAKKLSPRISSRICEMCQVIELSGKDKRIGRAS